jgi:galactokinase
MAVRSELLQEWPRFSDRAPRFFAAPGRVNLIGEHTDYNDGFVLPMAIDRQTVVAAALREDRRVRVHSRTVGETVIFDLDQPGPGCRGLWWDYVEGMAQVLLEFGLKIPGADLLLASDVPLGAGLSSSASLEIAVGLALWSLSGEPLDRRQLALAGQKAEHQYAGNRCGIMDQFIATFGEQGNALLIDCRSLEIQLVPMVLPETRVVLCDTRVKHALSSSEYNLRRAECEKGVDLLRERIPGIEALRDVNSEQMLVHQGSLPEPIRRRCRHVVGENARTLAAVAAFRRGDLGEIRRLMAESHCSLRDDYQVSCRELDLLVDLAGSFPGVYGARMTGGGFGGCTVNLVSASSANAFCEYIRQEYSQKTGIEPRIYVSTPSAGAGEQSMPS